MNTRRKSKVLADAAAEQEDVPGPSQSDNATNTGLVINVPIDIDIESLKPLFPDSDLTTPTAETIISLYRLVLDQSASLDGISQLLDQARADVSRKEVELDQALQDQDSELGQLRASLDDVHKELDEVKAEKSELVTTKASLEAKLLSLTSNQTASSSETEELRRQVTTIGEEKRDLIRVVERLQDQEAQREEELNEQRTRLKSTRSELAQLQFDFAEARSNDTSSAFKVSSLQQELELLKNENTRNVEELTTQQETAAADRRDKHAQIVKLQSQVDSLTQENSSAQSQLEGVRRSHRAQQDQLLEALTKVQTLQGEISQQAAAFRAESETQKRLSELLNRRNEDATRRVEQIENDWNEVLAKATAAETQLKEDLEKERKRGDDLEIKLEQLRVVADNLGTPEIMTAGAANRFSTPGPATPGSVRQTPGFLLSPTASLATKLQKSGRSYTEVYAHYVKLDEELTEQKRETRRLEEALAQVLSDIEERAPIILAQREEYERISIEVSQLSTQLAQALEERDESNRTARSEAATSTRTLSENELLQKQLSDLGRQVQGLLREISVRDDPSLANVEFSEEDIDETDSDRVITSNLVLFTSLPQLQQQNQKLLRTARGLAAQWERREAAFKAELAQEETEALQEAQVAVMEMEAELDRQKSLVETHQKERDMYRAMLARQGKDTASFGQEGGNGSSAASNAMTADYKKMLEEQQAMFETFKTEMGIDSSRLKDDLAAAQKEVGQQGANIAKANAQIEFLNERIRISQNSAELQSKELSGLHKRNQQLQDAVSRTEIAAYHANDELAAAKGAAERLRNESASLRAENELFKSIEARLSNDNRVLLKEKTHLKDLMNNLQTIQAELERASEGDKRRLESQVKSLESQVHDTRMQLNKEIDSGRHLAMQKDFEIKELHTRIDRITHELSQSREAQVIAETSQTHLQARVDDLLTQVNASTARLAVYERRPNHFEGASQPDVNNGSVDANEVQQLRAEVADLRAELQIAEGELRKAKKHAEEYQKISQDTEDSLTALTDSFDTYKADTERALAEKSLEIQRLTTQYDAVQQDLTSALNERSEALSQLDSQRISFENDKRILEDTIADLSTVEERAFANQASVQEELRSQARLAQEAHEKYDREIVAHAEAVNVVTQLKAQVHELRGQLRDSQAAAEAAAATATNADHGWTSERESMRKQIEDLTARTQDLSSQNDLLHQHLETTTTQVARIRQAATDNVTGAENGDAATDPDDALAELRSVLTYVQREKKIADLQLDLHKQENARLKSASEHLSQNLESTRKLLAEERERASKSVASVEQHSELLERINQLNILRESNATLRSENAENVKLVQRLQSQLQQLTAEVDPIKKKNRVAEAELEALQQQIHRLEEDNKRWKNRTEDILKKHNRVDPAEMQGLRDEIVTLRTETERLETEVEKWKGRTGANKKAYDEFQVKTRTMVDIINAERDQVRAHNSTLQTQLDQATTARASEETKHSDDLARIASLETEKSRLEQSLANEIARTEATQTAARTSNTASLIAERDALLADKTALLEQIASLSAGSSVLVDTDRQEMEAALKKLKEEQTVIVARSEKLLRDNKSIFAENKRLASEVAALKQAATTATPSDAQESIDQRVAEVTAEAEKKQAEAVAAATAELRKQVDALTLTVTSTPPQVDLAAITEAHAAELKALEARLTESHAAELKAANDAAAAAVPASNPTGLTSSPAEIESAVALRLEEQKKVLEAEKTEALNVAEKTFQAKLREAEFKGKARDGKLAKVEAELAKARATLLEKTPTPAGSGATPGASGSSVPANSSPSGAAALPTRPGGAPTVGRGRGANARGVPSGPARGRGRGAILANVAAASASNNPGPSQTSILGAAGATKRPRESGEAPTGPQGDLAKRLKAAPVALNRTRVAAPTPPPQPPSS